MKGKTRQEAIDEIRKITKQSFAFIKTDKDGNCQEVYLCDLHKESELVLLVEQANAYKAQQAVLEAEELAKEELALKERESALNKRFERILIISAYNLLINDIQLGLVECENAENLASWFHSYLKGETSEITQDGLFIKYLALVKGE